MSDDLPGDLADLVGWRLRTFPVVAGPYRSVVRLTVEDEQLSAEKWSCGGRMIGTATDPRLFFSDGIIVAVAGHRPGPRSRSGLAITTLSTAAIRSPSHLIVDYWRWMVSRMCWSGIFAGIGGRARLDGSVVSIPFHPMLRRFTGILARRDIPRDGNRLRLQRNAKRSYLEVWRVSIWI